MGDRVTLSDVGKEFIAKAFTFARALYQSGDVNEFDNGRRTFFWVVHLAQSVEAFIRDGNSSDVRLYRTERIIRALRSCLGYRVKQSAFTNVWKSYYSYLHVIQLRLKSGGIDRFDDYTIYRINSQQNTIVLIDTKYYN